MNLQQMIAWVQAGQILVTAGVATVKNIRAWMASQNTAMTDEQLNEICDVIIAGATKHQALADADAGKQS